MRRRKYIKNKDKNEIHNRHEDTKAQRKPKGKADAAEGDFIIVP